MPTRKIPSPFGGGSKPFGVINGNVDGGSQSTELCPLPVTSWWRWLPAHGFTLYRVEQSRNGIRNLAILGEPRWFEAINGNAAVAIGAALRTVKKHGTKSIPVDLAMTALACSARDGDVSAISLMASTLYKRAAVEPRCAALSNSWQLLLVKSKAAGSTMHMPLTLISTRDEGE